MRSILPLLAILCFQLQLCAQIIVEKPVVAEQTHLELTILKIGLFKDSTVVDLSIENKLDQGGWFCTDRNTYIEDVRDHKRYKLQKTRNIPNCPATHNFSRIGEMVKFSLVFPGIPSGARILNMIEDCDKACFSFKGIILDAKLNNDINLYNKGVELYAANKINEAIDCFSKVVEIIPEFPTHVYGYSYYNLIKIYSSKGDKVTSRFWLDQLEKSSLPDKQYFIDELRKEGAIAR